MWEGEHELPAADGGDQAFVDEVLPGAGQTLAGAAQGPGDVGARDGPIAQGGEGLHVGPFGRGESGEAAVEDAGRQFGQGGWDGDGGVGGGDDGPAAGGFPGAVAEQLHQVRVPLGGGDCGGAAPTMEAVSAVAGALNGVDYRRHGLTLERMGLAGVDPDGIVAYARRGNSR